MSYKSKVYLLKSVPHGAPSIDTFDLQTKDILASELKDGQVIIKPVSPYFLQIIFEIRASDWYCRFKFNITEINDKIY